MPLSNRLAAEFFGTLWLGGCGAGGGGVPTGQWRAQPGGRDRGAGGGEPAAEVEMMRAHGPVSGLSRWRLAALACVLAAAPSWAATLEGEALYRERIMPPPGTVLVVTLEDASRADAPATELAAARMRLAGGPPYRWHLEYDERLVEATSRPVLRARIETPAGLWMTTDTVTAASTPSPVLQLRMVQAAPATCADAGTQAALNECAFQGFLEASAVMSPRLRDIKAGLKPAQRAAWRRVQKAWLTFSTEACQFESSTVSDGSAKSMVQWQCAARMTQQRTTDLSRLANCPEGDVACPVKTPRRTTP